MQDRAVATRLQVLRGAAQVFDQLGFKGASIGQISKTSGFTRGAIYFHFKSKDELAQQIIEEQHNISIAAGLRIAEVDAPAIDRLVMQSFEMGRQLIEDPIVRAGIRLSLEMQVDRGPTRPFTDWIEACGVVIDIAQSDGDIDPTLDRDQLAHFLVSAFTGVQLVSNALDGRAELEKRLTDMWRILLQAILAPNHARTIDQILSARLQPLSAEQSGDGALTPQGSRRSSRTTSRVKTIGEIPPFSPNFTTP
ncbi:MAG: TetR/AcrR family transcriptional regulator [Rhodococcus sp.]|nr:TetR/AcrR family transcriptional regulator [Rhodococcus sp. (in: high G+C Gram-positive bacteria)]